MNMDMESSMKMQHDMAMTSTVLGNQLPFSMLFWDVKDETSLIFSCVGLFIMGLLHEIFKRFEADWFHSERSSDANNMSNAKHLLASLYHGYLLMWLYVLMLSVMTYNVWIITSSLAGCTVGFFFFSSSNPAPNLILNGDFDASRRTRVNL